MLNYLYNPSVSFADSSLEVNCLKVAREATLGCYTREPMGEKKGAITNGERERIGTGKEEK